MEEETKSQRTRRRAAERKAEQEAEVGARLFEISRKNAVNNELTMIDDAMKAKKERYAMLVARTQNKYTWIRELHRQRKHRERTNGR